MNVLIFIGPAFQGRSALLSLVTNKRSLAEQLNAEIT